VSGGPGTSAKENYDVPNYRNILKESQSAKKKQDD
jgi:hypothetical protein